MGKPLSVKIKDTKNMLIDLCNQSELHPSVLEMIMKDIYLEIHSLAERYSKEEELQYIAQMKKGADAQTITTDTLVDEDE